jgi:signal transduction histidine kinase
VHMEAVRPHNGLRGATGSGSCTTHALREACAIGTACATGIVLAEGCLNAMSGSGLYQLGAAGAYLLPAVVWGVLARSFWRFLLVSRPRSRFFVLLPILATFVTLIYAFLAVFALVPADLYRRPPTPLLALFMISNFDHVGTVAVARHLVLYLPLHEEPPRRRWLVANYGLAALVGILAIFPGLMPGDSLEEKLQRFFVLRNLYIVVMLALLVRQLARFVRRGSWRPGGLDEVRSADMALLAFGVLGSFGWLLLAFSRRETLLEAPPPWLRLYDAVVALAIALPLAVRVLGEVVRGVLFIGTLGVATAALYLGASAATAGLADPRLRPLLDLGTVVGLLVLLVPGQAWVRAAIDRVVFRRSRRRREELQTFLQSLAPDLGTLECCRRALATLARVMHLRGGAILLDDGVTAVEGTFALEPIERVWPRGASAGRLPASSLAGYAMRELPEDLREAIMAAQIVAVLPIRSPRRRWGHLFLTAGFLAATFSDEDVQTVDSFANQLALVLEGTELLARAVAVERSLAHSEKLAAIGELAARIAHEIRNPVTAARSLAQQLAREPASPFAAEHELILTELERVERQVAALLRFARREEFRFEPVDLGELVRETIDSFRARLAAAGIGVAVDAAGGITARADREKLRQVLVNLIENAMAALAGTTEKRHLGLAVGGVNGTATVRVTDTGPGVPADALPHLFQPFFSLKEHGTGLGLAIAKRTVDAHGGRIAAVSPAGGGMTVHIELPLARTG